MLKDKTYARVIPGGTAHIVDSTGARTLCGYEVPAGSSTKADTIWRIMPCQVCAGHLRVGRSQ